MALTNGSSKLHAQIILNHHLKSPNAGNKLGDTPYFRTLPQGCNMVQAQIVARKPPSPTSRHLQAQAWSLTIAFLAEARFVLGYFLGKCWEKGWIWLDVYFFGEEAGEAHGNSQKFQDMTSFINALYGDDMENLIGCVQSTTTAATCK